MNTVLFFPRYKDFEFSKLLVPENFRIKCESSKVQSSDIKKLL